MNETNITRSIQLAVSKLRNVRLFRNNVGMGWAGQSNRLPSGEVIIKNPRPLHAGLCEGSSDLIGWKTITITPDMVGKEVAVFVAVEVKTEKGRPTDGQLNFIAEVNRSGGVGFVARGADESVRILKEGQ